MDCMCIEEPLENTSYSIEVNGQCMTFDYPEDVGTKCKAWDEGEDPYCGGDNADDYCGKQWCYVSPACMAADTQSSIFGLETAFSYEVCGEEGEIFEPAE